ncbi:hypothetical protein HDE_14132 [Halotydeus destructor]|nr:hypothetical protein HDE_14132 [Halotydeus destructor]
MAAPRASTSRASEGEPLQVSDLSNELTTLVKSVQSFNLHINVLKKLLNLKEHRSKRDARHYLEEPKVRKSSKDSSKEAECPKQWLEAIREKVDTLRREMDESHVLGFCLAYNVQRLQQCLTGLPVDPAATDDLLDSLWQKYHKSKANEDMLKFEFDEKRKLLRKLRQQLEQTRRDWKNFKVKKPDPYPESELQLWATVRAEWASRKAALAHRGSSEGRASSSSGAEVDSAVHSDDGGDADTESGHGSLSSSGSAVDFVGIFDERSSRLDRLEEECHQLVDRLARRHRPLAEGESVVASEEDYEEEDEDVDDEEEEEEDDEEEDDSTVQLMSPLFADELLVGEEEDLLVASDGTFDDLDEEMEVAMVNAALVASGGEPLAQSGQEGDTAWGERSGPAPEMALNGDSLATDGGPPEGAGLTVNRSRSWSLVSRTTDEGDPRLRETFAETGEPVVLCRLRRKAVEILIDRLREEKRFHEIRENELKGQLVKLRESNCQLQRSIDCLHWRTGFGQHVGLTVVGVLLLANIVSAFNLFI